jgi:hypothetical protein
MRPRSARRVESFSAGNPMTERITSIRAADSKIQSAFGTKAQ